MDANSMRALFILKYESQFGANKRFDDREISAFLNAAQDEFTSNRFTPDSNIKGKGFEDDSKRRVDLSGLVTAHAVFTKTDDDFMLGNETNGALRTPDLDNQIGSSGTYVETDWGVFVRVPNECLFVIEESATQVKDNDTYDFVDVKPIQHRDYKELLRNPYKAPYNNMIWRLDWGSFTTASTASSDVSVKGAFTGDSTNGGTTTITTERSHHLIPAKGFEITKYWLRYVKRPASIVVDVIRPANQRNCELLSFTHTEVVDIAVRLAAASQIPANGKYQVSDKETKEND